MDMDQDTRVPATGLPAEQQTDAAQELQPQVLFCAESVYQVFNAVTLRMTERKDAICDLCLSNQTTWEDALVQRLRDSQLFAHVFTPDVHGLDEYFWAATVEERIEMVQDPGLYFKEEGPLPFLYKELFVPMDHIYWKMIFRHQVCQESIPAVYMYDEGVRAYTMPLADTDKKAYFAFAEYRVHPFLASVKGYYLHMPAAYSVGHAYPLLQIPNPKKLPEVREMLLKIYGYEEMPQETYIYLEDFFFADHCTTNDFELFKQVAEAVGKENIIVKRHPRDKFDRFAPMGYKTLTNSVVPWEIQLLANDYRSKVLISVSSTAALTPYIIFDTDMHVISLEKLFVGENPTHKDAAFRSFFEWLKKQINEEKIRFHSPATVDELLEVIRYLKLLMTFGGNADE